ncbi:MAG: hypothetical protein IT535_08945 [Bauldia sp.]|nr:hypothetical protein [Bauldia sp.]
MSTTSEQGCETTIALLRSVLLSIERTEGHLAAMKLSVSSIERTSEAIDGELAGLTRRMNRIDRTMNRIELRLGLV